MESTTLHHARRLWEFMSARATPEPCEAIVVCCSYDLRVCDHACELLRRGLAPLLILSGNTGNWTRHLWEVPEAQVFRQRALERGVAPEQILTEERATNFGENIAFTRRMRPELRSATFLTKPNSVRRVRLTVPVQWPGLIAGVDAPPLEFPGDVSNVVGLLGVIDEMVGDLDRIVQYPARGFQVSCPVPEEVMEAWRWLVEQGFTHHLLPRTTAEIG
jgi:uncharacterized SAM-binding protein YcdF (DUF218 family)